MILSGNIPSSAPRDFNSFGFNVKANTKTIDTPNTQNTDFGNASKIPTIVFVTQYIEKRIPAQPNSAKHVESGALQTPFQIRASIKCVTPIVKHKNIML